jgi:hypothetical protein
MTDLYYLCTPKTEAWLAVKARLDALNTMVQAGWEWGKKHGVPMKAPKPLKRPKGPTGRIGPKDANLFDDTDGGSRAGNDDEDLNDTGPTRMSYSDNIHGFTRPGSDATAWRLFEGVWVPNKGTKAGKALAKERADLPQAVDGMKWSSTLFKHGMVMGREEGGRGPGMLLRYASSGCKIVGKGARQKLVAVVRMHTSVKKAAKHWPKGMVEITGSKAEKLVG